MTAGPTVFVIDDDPGMRDALQLLLRSVDLSAETFASADEFLAAYDPQRPGCLVLDVRMPGMSGLVLQERLASLGADLPVIFITAHADVPMAVQTVKAGAVDFIEKPFRDQELLERIQQAMEQNRLRIEVRTAREEVRARIGSLTPRERQVLTLIAAGKPNKVIAIELGLSQRTVEIHRAHVMHKMRADSAVELLAVLQKAAAAGV